MPNWVWVCSQVSTQIAYQGLAIGRHIRLKRVDVDAIRNDVPSVVSIYDQSSVGIWDGSPAYTVYKGNNGSFSVQGTHAGMANIHQQKILEGRYINELDDQQR